MKILLTNDGMILLNIDGKVIKANSVDEALAIMWGHYGPRKNISKTELEHELLTALDIARKNHHDEIYFGVLGYFLFSSKEEESCEF